MKELSIEEKAKAYDELKVKAQELTEDGYIDKLALLDLFPELKESEDERIRKELIKETKGSEVRLFETVTNDEFVAWLKSLKTQNKWKPSDEQMKALSDINCTGYISYAGQGQELINLYNGLKKLKS